MSDNTLGMSVEAMGLALQIADDAARSDIEMFCARVDFQERTWWNTNELEHGVLPPARAWVDRAARYLAERGRLVRNASHPHLVRFFGVPA